MAATTRIEWADETYNPWIGCGPGKPRRRTKTARDVRKWNRAAGELIGAGWPRSKVTSRVFTASLADVFDPEVPVEWLVDLLDLIDESRHLDFLLLTKRPELWRERLEAVCDWESPGRTNMECPACFWLEGDAPENVWIGTTVEDQRRAEERLPHLLSIPARVRFLSCEPLLGAVDLPLAHPSQDLLERQRLEGIHQVICGGESGRGARPMHPDWALSLRDQCHAAGTPFFFKQWGAWLGGAYTPKELGAPAELAGDPVHDWGEGAFSVRVGKRAAGRELDGREWNEFPGEAA